MHLADLLRDIVDSANRIIVSPGSKELPGPKLPEGFQLIYREDILKHSSGTSFFFCEIQGKTKEGLTFSIVRDNMRLQPTIELTEEHKERTRKRVIHHLCLYSLEGITYKSAVLAGVTI